MNITHINARQVLDSRGTPTVEAEVWCEGDNVGRAIVPSGASTGTYEAHELRDGGDAFAGKAVHKAIEHVTSEIKDALIGVPADDQHRIDETMIALDGTEHKSRLGANAILAVSLAAAHAAAAVRHIPLFQHIHDIAGNPAMSLPMPMINVLNGGRHATKSADFQEYMLVPVGATNYQEAMRIAVEIFMNLKTILREQGSSTTVGDEGGFAPSVASNTEMLDLLMTASEQAGYTSGQDIVFALDIAASEFYTDGTYNLATEDRNLDTTELIDYLADISKRYPVVSIEDGLTEDAWEGWTQLTTALSTIQVVGDDLLVTNQARLERGIAEKAGNAILIKPNQIGTLTETITAITHAKEHGWNTIVSHRSGETEDTTIAHLAVGAGTGQIKTGSVSRGERTAKHNELLRIEDTHQDIIFANPFTN